MAKVQSTAKYPVHAKPVLSTIATVMAVYDAYQDIEKA
jgi:hypothetical protein